MKGEFNVPEVKELFNEIPQQLKKLFEMIRVDIQETVGRYLSGLISMT
ncbi:MAG: hypothetical protein J0652_04035 [Desulfobulbaceae bacterium]|jgi:hypothetical protein|nr:hypothetical protein [Desulfobulbaceae bacterium]